MNCCKFLPVLALVIAAGQTSSAQSLLTPVSVSGAGSFSNDAGLIADSVIPDRGTAFNAATNVFWEQANPVQFVLDYGQNFVISDVLISADNNDDYLIEHSIDNVNFTAAFTFEDTDGPVNAVGPGGLDILTTISTFPTNVDESDPQTPANVNREFNDVVARYLRVTSPTGDVGRSIGEFQAFGAAIPEPSTCLPLVVLALLKPMRRRRISAS